MGVIQAATLSGSIDAKGVITGTVDIGKGDKGDPGFSPKATVTKADGVATITVTDGDGTTTATVSDGAQGPQGEQGIQGERGETGPQGIQGPKGDKGEKGDTGEQGPTGPQGPAGATGATGAQGIQGEKGDKGDTGATGPAGPVNVPSTTSPIKGDGSGGLQAAVAETDYASPVVMRKVTLTVAGWNSTTLQQSVTVSGVLADTTKQCIYPYAVDTSYDSAWNSCGVLCVAQAANSLTFQCSEVPTTAIEVYVTIVTVRYA